jgi:hypothetical protein
MAGGRHKGICYPVLCATQVLTVHGQHLLFGLMCKMAVLLLSPQLVLAAIGHMLLPAAALVCLQQLHLASHPQTELCC